MEVDEKIEWKLHFQGDDVLTLSGHVESDQNI